MLRFPQHLRSRVRDIKPTACDWLTGYPIALMKKIRLTDPLLKPPFAAAPPDSLKGMAAGIRAVQLDVPNRVKAVRYLGTLDCVTYPQAQDMLIATMEEDPSEIVRYEAVMALRNMLTRGSCAVDTGCECETCSNKNQIVRQTERHAKKGERQLIKEAKGPAKKSARKAYRDREAEDERYDCCRGCANAKVMKALAKVASEKDDECCWVEPSERVRQAAAEAMCLFRNYLNGYSLPESGISPTEVDGQEEKSEGEAEPSKEKEATPDGKSEARFNLGIPTQSSATLSTGPQHVNQLLSSQPSSPIVRSMPDLKTEPQAVSYPVVAGLRGRCVVALKSRQVIASDPRFASVFEERTYYFSSEQAKAAFDQNPRNYAPAYGGLDPVSWLTSRQMEDGTIIREHNGQFFLFSSKENWETFRAAPQRYVLKTAETNLRPASGQQ